MNHSTGARLAMGVAVIFCAACDKGDKPQQAKAQPTPGAASAASRAAPPLNADEMGNTTGDEVQCLGIHECKGKSACHVADGHACAGMNECKGKGWIVVPKAECDAKGGTINAS
jgi:hypothetical protein